MCAGGHEVKGSSDDGDELHDLYAHAGSPGNPAIRLAIRAPKVSASLCPNRDYASGSVAQEPNGDHPSPSDEAVDLQLSSANGSANSLHAGALCRQCSSFCPPEWVGGRVHGAHYGIERKSLRKILPAFGLGRVSRKRTSLGT